MTHLDFKKLENLLKNINDEDLKCMFGTSIKSVILKDRDKVVQELIKYSKYDMPVKLGTIFEVEGKKYKVCCVYTDNSVDICNEEGSRINTGLYKHNIKIIGQMEAMTISI